MEAVVWKYDDLLNSSSAAASQGSSNDGRFAGQYPALEHFCCLKGETRRAELTLQFWFRGWGQKMRMASTEGPSKNLGLAFGTDRPKGDAGENAQVRPKRSEP